MLTRWFSIGAEVGDNAPTASGSAIRISNHTIPIAEAIRIDLIWFGVLMLLALEIGQTTPPFGMLLFVMRGVAPAETTMRHIYAAVTPFVLLEIAILAFLIAVPGAVTWLPALMAG